jgi:hypothetical protein
MALTSGVASTAWETALYQVLDLLRATGNYASQYDFNKVGISDADKTTILNGYNTYLTNKANAGRTFIDKQKANPANPYGSPQTTTWQQNDKQTHPTL